MTIPRSGADSGRFRFGSVCSGIDAASVAWNPLGWEAAFFSEIEPFPSSLLGHHYPSVPNYGDLNAFRDWPDANLDLLVGGTPCQSFSVAGLRRGMADPRGNLALVYLALADRYRPRWIVWENVPGVLSSNGGRDFGAFLGGLAKLGYGWAYRVLDAQHFGVPQRRRRVFVVGYLGDWRRAAAVLFEPASLRGDSPPSREARERVANALTERPDRGGGNSEGQRLIAGCLNSASGHAVPGNSLQDVDRGYLQVVAYGGNNTSGAIDLATACNAHAGRRDFESETLLVAFDTTQVTSKANRSQPKPGDPCHPLAAGAHAPAVAFGCDVYNGDETGETAATLNAASGAPSHSGPKILMPSAVRRLTPRECERLQGFPDDWTLIPYRGKPASDGPRYKALGNSRAVPVMRWIGERILKENMW